MPGAWRSGTLSLAMDVRAFLQKSWVPPLTLGLAAFVSVAVTLDDPGVTWDEAYPNIPAAERQAEWLTGLGGLEAPFSQATVDAHWETTSDHPSFARTCAAVSYLVLGRWLGEITAYRLPSAVWFGLLVAGVGLLAGTLRGPLAAWTAGLALLLMPRMFGHAHFYSLDMPITALWFWAAAAFAWALGHPRRAPWAAAVYALAFATKLHAVFMPPLLLVVGLAAWYERVEEREAVWRGLLVWFGCAALLTPLIYLLTQPWLWHETGPRLVDRFLGYASKVPNRPIHTWYLGTRYGGDTPWHYPLLLTATTVPPGTLLLALTGLGAALFRPRCLRGFAWSALLLGGWLVPLLLVLLPLAQAYDGVRIFLPGFSFLAVLAGVGAAVLEEVGRNRILEKPYASAQIQRWRLLAGLVIVMVFVEPAGSLLRLHPNPLAYYTPLVGGLSGARRLGMETTYWCDALSPEFLERIDERVPAGAKVKSLAMPIEVLEYYQREGQLDPSLRFHEEPPYDFHILQCRQGMFTGVEWNLYLNHRPLERVERDGVLLYALYGPL